jgi:hypothetical protein
MDKVAPLWGTLVEIAAVAMCGPAAPVCSITAAFASATFVAGVTSGNLRTALKAGLIAGVTALAFYEVGTLTDVISGATIGSHTPPVFGTDAYAFNVAGHALVGCASAVASGGKCGPAALAGAVTSAAAPFINGQNFAANVVKNAVLGGLASVAGGGKFANGAITSAFGYLLNNAAGALRGAAWGGGIGGSIAGILGSETGPGDIPIVLAGRWIGATIGAAIGDWLTGPDIVNSLTPEEEKTIRSLEKNIEEHRQKLDDYRQDPDAYDNQGFLKNAASEEIRERIIQGRIDHLENEIANWQRQIDALRARQ